MINVWGIGGSGANFLAGVIEWILSAGIRDRPYAEYQGNCKQVERNEYHQTMNCFVNAWHPDTDIHYATNCKNIFIDVQGSEDYIGPLHLLKKNRWVPADFQRAHYEQYNETARQLLNTVSVHTVDYNQLIVQQDTATILNMISYVLPSIPVIGNMYLPRVVEQTEQVIAEYHQRNLELYNDR
mgnify:CR=1 FL=1